MPLTREQMLRNLAKARAARKRNLKMRGNPDGVKVFSKNELKVLNYLRKNNNGVYGLSVSVDLNLDPDEVIYRIFPSLHKRGLIRTEGGKGYDSCLVFPTKQVKFKMNPKKEGPVAPKMYGPVAPKMYGPVKRQKTKSELRSELKGMAKASRERLSNLSPVQKKLISELGTLDSNVKSLLKKGRTSGALTAALKKAIATKKKLSVARMAKLKTRRPTPEGKAIPMKSYTVRFFVASGAGDIQHVGNDLHYFTVRAAATDAKSIVRAAVGKDPSIYEGGYEGWLSDDESTNKALETAKALGVSFGGGGKTLPLSEAPASVIKAVEPAIDENADEAFKSNPKKVFTSVKVRSFRDKNKTIPTRSSQGLGARWENVLQTNEEPKMFLHPKLYVSQKSDGMAILAVITEDKINRRPAQVKSLSSAVSGKKLTVKAPKK